MTVDEFVAKMTTIIRTEYPTAPHDEQLRSSIDLDRYFEEVMHKHPPPQGVAGEHAE